MLLSLIWFPFYWDVLLLDSHWGGFRPSTFAVLGVAIQTCVELRKKAIGGYQNSLDAQHSVAALGSKMLTSQAS